MGEIGGVEGEEIAFGIYYVKEESIFNQKITCLCIDGQPNQKNR